MGVSLKRDKAGETCDDCVAEGVEANRCGGARGREDGVRHGRGGAGPRPCAGGEVGGVGAAPGGRGGIARGRP